MAKRKRKVICNHVVFCNYSEFFTGKCEHALPHAPCDYRFMWKKQGSRNCTDKYYHQKCFLANEIKGRQCIPYGS